MDERFRELTSAERKVIERLLQERFDGRNELLCQLDGAQVRAIDPNGSLSFRINGPTTAKVRTRVPVEAAAPDVDGASVHVLLHVVDGRMTELEVYREDLRPVLQFPAASKLTVMCAG